MLKFFESKKWKIAWVALASLAILLGGSPTQSEARQTDAMTLFKEAYLAEPESHRIMNANIDFFGPNAHWDVDAKLQMLTDTTMCSEGQKIEDPMSY